MGNFDNKPNDELMRLLKEMEITHENIKARMLKDYDNMLRVERDYKKVKQILGKRLK